MADVFKTLNEINVNDKTERKNNLTYLSWAWAWAEVKKHYPEANYEILKFGGVPYAFDPNTGYMVYTTVTIDGQTHEMWLPVMDEKNRAMKAEPYTIKTSRGEIEVKAATMFDVNKTIMRCLTKNLAMFGLGLYIYAGEDLPEKEAEEREIAVKQMGQKIVVGAQIKALTDLCQRKGVPLETVYKHYDIKDFSEMTTEMWTSAVSKLNKTADK